MFNREALPVKEEVPEDEENEEVVPEGEEAEDVTEEPEAEAGIDDEEDEPGMWDEMFKTHKDSKPYGMCTSS